jgi:uncharacterized phage protein gp47/JayE
MQYNAMNRAGEWGLTPLGFRRPEYADILDAWELRARELFGDGANLTVRSPLGMFIRIFAWFGGLVWQVLEDVYNSRFIDTAVGASLYNLGRFIGLQLLPAQRAAGSLLVTGTPGTVVPVGWLAANTEGAHYTVLTRGVIGADGTVLVPARAVLAGPEGAAEENTITQIVNPAIPSGIESVTNPGAFTGGRDRETDEEFRDRYYRSVDFAGGVNIDAIVSEVLQNTPGVLSAIGFENCTDFTDANGLPPHSIELIVYGGQDADVAAAIFRRKAAGIQTYGDVVGIALGANSLTYEIRFNRPSPTPVWIKVWDVDVDLSLFPPNGRELILNALWGYIGGTGVQGLAIGQTVYYKRLPAVVYSVPGVLNFEMTVSMDGIQYGYDDIPIDPRHKAVTDPWKIAIL